MYAILKAPFTGRSSEDPKMKCRILTNTVHYKYREKEQPH